MSTNIKSGSGLRREAAMAELETISVKPLHPTFAAEIGGVDFQNLSEKQFCDILAAMAKYGVCVFRKTGLTDTTHVDFSRRLGELDTIRKYMIGGRKPRYEYYELFDAGNVDDEGNVLDPNSPKALFQRGNALFHVDSSFNPRRASYSLLRAVKLPPPGNGGNTEFADSRTAFEELPASLKDELLKNDYVGAHTIAQSRKLGAPHFFKDLDPSKERMALHKLVQKHEPSGRMNLYVAAHCHHLEGPGMDEAKSQKLLDTLLKHTTQDKYVTSIAWENDDDMIIWDNRCVMHRAAGGSFEGRYVRDLRRTTVHDDSPTAWGLNLNPDGSQPDDWVSSAAHTAAGRRSPVTVQ